MSTPVSKKIIFFEVLKNLREQENLSVTELSRNLNLSKNTIDNYEFRKITPPYKNLIKIANYYGVSIDYLLLGKQTKFIRNIKLFKLALELDSGLLQEMAKVENYIDTFLDRRKTTSKVFDKLDCKLNGSFNNNLKILIKNQSSYTGKEIANKIGVSEKQLSTYKRNIECTYDILLNISNLFNISMHWLITGDKLSFDFNNKNFKNLMLQSDEHLQKEHIDTTIKIMEQIIKSNN